MKAYYAAQDMAIDLNPRYGFTFRTRSRKVWGSSSLVSFNMSRAGIQRMLQHIRTHNKGVWTHYFIKELNHRDTGDFGMSGFEVLEVRARSRVQREGAFGTRPPCCIAPSQKT